MCKCYCEGDAQSAAGGSGGSSGDRAGEMVEEQCTVTLCSGGVSHQASCISHTCNSAVCSLYVCNGV